MFVTGTPFCLFEHPTYQKWLSEMNPDFKIISRKPLSTTTLDQHYSEMESRVEASLMEAKILHLSVDGWSNLRNEGILNVIIYTPKPVLYCTIETKDNRHTSLYLYNELSKIIDKLGPMKFVTIITDNAANMKRCGEMLREKYSNVQWSGCVAHTIHLCVMDILKIESISEIVSKVTAIVKCIKKSQILTAIFQQLVHEKNINVSLHLPVKTRWGSYTETLSTFLKSKNILQNLAIDDANSNILNRDYKLVLLDDDFWLRITKIHDVMSCFTKWITILEGDYSSIHKVVPCFEEINVILNCTDDILSQNESSEIKTKIDSRKSQAVRPFHYAACILDPKNRGSTLDDQEHLKGCEFIIAMVETTNSDDVVEIMQQLSCFKLKTGLWENIKINEQMTEKLHPLEWWNMFYEKTKLAQLAALKILSIPVTSAAVERSFSTFGNIHSKKRNRLSTKRAAKLTYISHNWRLLFGKIKPIDNVQSDESQDESDTSSSVSQQVTILHNEVVNSIDISELEDIDI